MGFPGALEVNNPSANARNIRDVGLIPGWGRFPGGGHGSPLQYSCLENPMGRGFGRLQSRGSQWLRVRNDWSNLAHMSIQYYMFSTFLLPSLWSFFNNCVFVVVVQSLNCVWLCDPMNYSRLGLPCSPLFPRVHSNSFLLSQCCHPTIVASASLCLSQHQGIFPMNQFFTSGGQSIGASTSASVLPVNIQDWFPLGLTGLISLQFRGLSRVFSNTTVQKHQFLGIQSSLWSNCHIHTRLLEKP